MNEELDARVDSRVKWYSVSRVLLLVFIGLMLAGIAGGLGTIAVQNNQVLLNVQTGTDRLVDCTTPGGKCYEQGSRSQSAAVKTINEMSVYAAYCAHKPDNDTVQEIKSCIEQELKVNK